MQEAEVISMANKKPLELIKLQDAFDRVQGKLYNLYITRDTQDIVQQEVINSLECDEVWIEDQMYDITHPLEN